MKHLQLGAAARRRLITPVRMGGFVASVVVVVGLLAAACSSSTSPAASTRQVVDTTRAPTSNWSTVDVNTGSITPVPGSIATSGSFYVVSPDQTKVAYNPCCNWETPVRMANLDGTQVHNVSAAGSYGVGEQWSPDGSAVVYQQRDGSGNELGNLFVQNLATGQRTRVTNLDQTREWGWWFTFPSFSPDGKSILYQRPNNDNRSWDLWSRRSLVGSRPSSSVTPRGAVTHPTVSGSPTSHRSRRAISPAPGCGSRTSTEEHRGR